MGARDILLLGDPDLHEKCRAVRRDELPEIAGVVEDLHDTLMAWRKLHASGRAIAAPQIGVRKRVVYMCIDAPVAFINPVLTEKSRRMIELWDDCLSFPGLFVRVKRHARCRITFRDLAWHEQTMILEGDLSELLQHECDHLDGVLAVERAIDGRSFSLQSPGFNERRTASPKRRREHT
ncbi:MAG: peptide deformylase [Chitinivibrionia bacterium]|nr:peptide deformylase [Chitinivibrionia bacterium]